MTAITGVFIATSLLWSEVYFYRTRRSQLSILSVIADDNE